MSKVEIRPPSDTLTISMTGWGRFEGMDSYQLRVDIHVTRAPSSAWLVVHPENLAVWFEGQSMVPQGHKRPAPDSTRSRELRKTLKFDLSDPRLADIERAPSDLPGQGAVLKIALDGFLYYDGLPVRMDTVSAVESGAGNLWESTE